MATSGLVLLPDGKQNAHQAAIVYDGAIERQPGDVAPLVFKLGSIGQKTLEISNGDVRRTPRHYALSSDMQEVLALVSLHETGLTPPNRVAPHGPFTLVDAPHPESLRDIMLRFESLGDNCEFGLVQRRAGAEPLDFLRFAGFYVAAEDLLQQTIKALTNEFSGIGDPTSIVCELHGDRQPREYMIRDVEWRLMYHSGLHEDEIDPDVLRSQQGPALCFRRRVILANMKAAERVFVWKSSVGSPESKVRELLACLKRHGPNLLLWVSIEDDDHPAGLVEYAGSGLLKGYVRRFAPYAAAEDIEFESWYAMCRNAAAAADRLRQLGEWSHATRDS
jgi:hypothetical protein